MLELAAAAVFARLTVLAPREGQVSAFEAGYRAHLAWHREKGDPWTWHGWTVVNGDRAGTFVDATFSHAAGELDAPVDPTGDAADNAANVLPHAVLASTAVWRLRADLGALARVEDAPWQELTWIRVAPERVGEFEVAARGGKLPGACLELVSGGSVGSYVVFAPARKPSEILDRPRVAALPGVVEMRTEVLRHRPDLTYVPGP